MLEPLFAPCTISMPSSFTFPYHYYPHPLAEQAIEALQMKLPVLMRGQMFAVLVVQTTAGELGYLNGFSGYSVSTDCHQIDFVPPLISDTKRQQIQDEFEVKMGALEAQISTLENAAEFVEVSNQLERFQTQAEAEIKALQIEMVAARKQRKQLRQLADEQGNFQFLHTLNQQSIEQKMALQQLKANWQKKIRLASTQKALFVDKIESLKSEAEKLKIEYQYRLNQEFQFLNSFGETTDLNQIALKEHVSDLQDEAIVKLLQFAFQQQLLPLAFAQFWWGPSPENEVRHHGRIYPISRTKCASVLEHMLSGIAVQADPLIARLSAQQYCEIVYQDDDLVVINKPVDLLSVPGVNIDNSVYTQMQRLFPNATGPLIVHRLDMATSGLMVVALNQQVHKHLQQQFIHRTVEKRYVALLDGVLTEETGTIHLPLRPDLVDRPRQVVCTKYGRDAETRWQVIERDGEWTRVYFYPKTGRSHQLRMHAAHQAGLNMPIVGDDLYGKTVSNQRLHLHADLLVFTHPTSKQRLIFLSSSDF